MKTRRLVITLLAIVLIGIFTFGYFFLVRRSPLDEIKGVSPSATYSEPKFLFAINNEPAHPLDRPMAVAVVNNRIFVSDSGRNQVLVFDYNGHFEKYLKPGAVSFRTPYGLTFDGTNLYVADTTAGKIYIFDAGGNYKGVFDVQGVTLAGPGVILAQGGKLYVSDLQNQKIFVFDLQGRLLKTYGREGSGAGELSFPHGVAVDAQGSIYVADSGNNRIIVYNVDGSVRETIGGGGNSDILTPRGLIRDRSGNLWVVSGMANKIIVYHPDGSKIMEFGKEGQDYGQFSLPNGVYIDDNDRVYITEVGTSRVSVFNR